MQMTPEEERKNRKALERHRAMRQHFPSTAVARNSFRASHKAMLRLLRRQSRTAEIVNWGPDALHTDLYDEKRVSVITGLGDDYWDAVLKVDTDELRDRLKNDKAFLADLWQAARDEGFAPHTILIESQETVDRDYRGNWGLRSKG